MFNTRARLVSVLASTMLAAGVVVLPIAPSLADDPTATPTSDPSPTTDPTDPCGLSAEVLNQLGNLYAVANEQQQQWVAINRTTARQQHELMSAYKEINRKDLRIARLKARLREMRTGLHG